jgi:hypothetical protein
VKFIMTSRLCIELSSSAWGRVASSQRLTCHNYVSTPCKSLHTFPLALSLGIAAFASRRLKDQPTDSIKTSLNAMPPLIAQKGGQQVLPETASEVARKAGVLFRLGLVTREHTKGWVEGIRTFTTRRQQHVSPIPNYNMATPQGRSTQPWPRSRYASGSDVNSG